MKVPNKNYPKCDIYDTLQKHGLNHACKQKANVYPPDDIWCVKNKTEPRVNEGYFIYLFTPHSVFHDLFYRLQQQVLKFELLIESIVTFLQLFRVLYKSFQFFILLNHLYKEVGLIVYIFPS